MKVHSVKDGLPPVGKVVTVLYERENGGLYAGLAYRMGAGDTLSWNNINNEPLNREPIKGTVIGWMDIPCIVPPGEEKKI